MSSKDKTVSPQTLLVIGCGLIGTSMAMALRDNSTVCRIDGVEFRRDYRDIAAETMAFDEIFDAIPETTYDLAILALPIDVACIWLERASNHADIVLDVCSVKQDICDAAIALEIGDSFAPSHPMAGLAFQGPKHAHASMFVDNPWICLENWSACREVAPLLQSIGAKVVWMTSAQAHDEAMAAISHGIHITSIAAMLAATNGVPSWDDFANITGPAFRDITRLSASSPSFWPATLLANREAVQSFLNQMTQTLVSFKDALDMGDEKTIAHLLLQAKEAHDRWESNV